MRRNKFILLFLFLSICLAQNTEVLTGIEVLKKHNFSQLAGLNIGLITNQTGLDNNINSTIDLLHNSDKVNLICLLGPEHGVRGDVDAGKKVYSYKDKTTNLPVYSLYGATRKPTQEMLKGLDALVYDIQDIGCRSYTFISTMGLAMEAAAENNIKFFVLDRPNPLGGNRVEGNIPEENFISFISKFKIPYIYGLTCGELARLINGEKWLANQKQCDLNIIKMENWSRDLLFDDCDLIWIPTSPHIPKIKTTLYYPATGILGELRSYFNIGVGYTLPFEMILTENINAKKLETALNNKYDSDDILFRNTSVIPYYTNFKGKRLEGLQVYIRNKKIPNLINIQFNVLEEILKLKPELLKCFTNNEPQNKMFDKAIGTDKIRKFIIDGKFKKISDYLNKDINSFKELSKKYYLY